jgi:hypothetical protein
VAICGDFKSDLATDVDAIRADPSRFQNCGCFPPRNLHKAHGNKALFQLEIFPESYRNRNRHILPPFADQKIELVLQLLYSILANNAIIKTSLPK